MKNLKKVMVIAEAGSNWKVNSYEEDLSRAKELISVARNAGADAVKFQTFRPETVFVENAGKVEYLKKKGIDKSINEIFEHNSMPYEMIPELAKFCKKQKIMFMSTPFSIEDAKQIDPYVEIHKIASFEINHLRLLEFLAKTKKPVIISTGASEFQEIDFAVKNFYKNGGTELSILQCTSKYPAPISTLNLRVIPELIKKYDVTVGFSDHSLDPLIGPVVAVAMGAKIIEKHFTINRNLPGPDHSSSLNPDELKLMIMSIRNAEKALGNNKKKILAEEMELRNAGTRAIQAIKNISKGEILKEGENFEILRPGLRKRGLEPRFLEEINNKKSTKNILKGDGIMDFR